MLHGDRAERRERLRTAGASARSDTDACAPAPARPRRAGPGLSQIAFEMPSRPRSCTRPARRSVRTASSGQPETRARPRPRAPRPRGAWPRRVGRFQIDEVRDREERGVELLAGKDDRERRLGPDDGIPRPDRIEVGEDHVRLRAHERRERGVELLPAALAGERLRRARRPDAVRDLGELGQLREPAPRSGPPRP